METLNRQYRGISGVDHEAAPRLMQRSEDVRPNSASVVFKHQATWTPTRRQHATMNTSYPAALMPSTRDQSEQLYGSVYSNIELDWNGVQPLGQHTKEDIDALRWNPLINQLPPKAHSPWTRNTPCWTRGARAP